LSFESQDAMHTLGSHRVYIHGIHKIKSIISKGMTWHVTPFETIEFLFACWDCGLESHRGHGWMSVLSVVRCQVEVSATGWSLVHRRILPTVMRRCLWSGDLKN